MPRRAGKIPAVFGQDVPNRQRVAVEAPAARYALWVKPAAALAVVLPCFWLPRIQAGDLSSHAYNAWLAELIRHGRAPGLTFVPQFTNVLFDLLLDTASRAFGPHAGQQIAVAIAVLLFFLGALLFAGRVSGSRPLHLIPVLAMLAYGWIFRMGLSNFYLSLGICFFALAMGWQWQPRALLAVPLLALAWCAHTLPVLWAIAVLGFAWAPERLRTWLLGGGVAAMFVLHVLLRTVVEAHWFSEQLKVVTGADQAYIYDDKYLIPAVGLGLLFAWWLFSIVRTHGWRQLVADRAVQIAALSAAGIAILPSVIIGRSFQAAYLANRMSVVVAVCLCAAAAARKPRAVELYFTGALALLFFAFSYYDERNLNLLEDQMEAAVSTVPPQSRVVSVLHDSTLHVDPLVHMIDRACIGRCYSYANYEPSTPDFRIRASAHNPVVAATYMDSWKLQRGIYTVTASDLPLFLVDLDNARHIAIRPLREGPMHGLTEISALP
jgi:hypothetical protein